MTLKKKTILLLGGGGDQTYAIKTANKMGLRTLVVDANKKSPGFSIADDYAVVSTRDIESLKLFVDKYIDSGGRIDGVSVMGSDIPQYVAMIAEYLDLPHIPISSAILSVNKLEMKKCFKDKGVPIPWFKAINNIDELRSVIDKEGLPLIIKPIDRSGARGVFQIRNKEESHFLFEQAKNESFCGSVMVEKYLSGPQISTETIMYNGIAYTPGFVDRNYEKLDQFSPYIIENGGWEPSRVSAEQRKKIEQLVQQSAQALGVTNGVVKGDIVIAPEGPKIIEMATRLSGGDFSESLVPLGLGVNYVEVALQIAIGQEPDLNLLKPLHHQAVANRYFFPPSGELIAIRGLDIARKLPFVKKLEIWYEIGDIVPAIKSHADRFGVFIVVADNLEELEQRIELIYETVKIDILAVDC